MSRARVPQALAFIPGFAGVRYLLGAVAEPLGLLRPQALLWEAPSFLDRPLEVGILSVCAAIGAALVLPRDEEQAGRERRLALRRACLAGVVAGAVTFFGLPAVWHTLLLTLTGEQRHLLLYLRDPVLTMIPALVGAAAMRACAQTGADRALPPFTGSRQTAVMPSNVALQLAAPQASLLAPGGQGTAEPPLGRPSAGVAAAELER